MDLSFSTFFNIKLGNGLNINNLLKFKREYFNFYQCMIKTSNFTSFNKSKSCIRSVKLLVLCSFSIFHMMFFNIIYNKEFGSRGSFSLKTQLRTAPLMILFRTQNV